jgi:c-di-GMP-binding flagellar brake protein YcgR
LTNNPSDRRASPRFYWKGTAVIVVPPCGPNVVGVLHDLSEGGCRIELEDGIPCGSGGYIEVVLYVRGFELRQTGIIRRMEGRTRAGIQFLDVTNRRAEQLRHVMKALFGDIKKSAAEVEEKEAATADA